MSELPTTLWQTYGEAAAIQLRDTPGREIHLSADSWLALTGERRGWLNYAYIADSHQAVDRLHQYDAIIRARGGQVTAILPRPMPDALAAAARLAGWQPLGPTPLMVCTARPQGFDAGGFSVARVAAEGQLQGLRALIAAGFGIAHEAATRIFTVRQLTGPGMAAFVASRDGIAVSTATVTRSGALAGIFWVATSPEHRRQGAAQTVLLHTLANAFDEGAIAVYLAASDAGKPLYERLGFRTVEEVEAWAIDTAQVEATTEETKG